MDPRRARDPRLARVDRPTSTQNSDFLHSVNAENVPMDLGRDQLSQMEPQLYPQTSSVQITNAGRSDVLNSSQSPLPLAGFKRPLFCIVCASNQVGPLSRWRTPKSTPERFRTVPWKDIMCSRALFFGVIYVGWILLPLSSKAGYRVISSGTGSAVRLPGPSIDKPNIYSFGTPYNSIYEELDGKDSRLWAK